MISVLKNQKGFTFLELVVSLVIIAMIVALTMTGVNLGIRSRDAGNQKAELYQRLRFISAQMSGKIKSFHPMFYSEKFLDSGEEENASAKNKSQPKRLAFEGDEKSIRFISFADVLTSGENPPYMHEVRFFLGENPKTEESGVILMEREGLYDEIFTEPDPEDPGTRFITLARDVSYLKFRYYKVDPLTEEEKELEGEDAKKYKGDWVDSLYINQLEKPTDETGEAPSTKNDKNQISVPRAVEVSLGLYLAPLPGEEEQDEEERETIELPPTVVPLHSGIEFIRHELEDDEKEDKGDREES